MGSTAIVTGSDSGIGRATAIALARAGWDVGVTWRSDEAGAQETARSIRATGRHAAVAQLDLAQPQQAAEKIDALADALGSTLQVFVNNAGISHRAPFLALSLADWDRMIAVNLTGAFSCAQAAARLMAAAGEGGRIVNVTSVHEHVPLRGSASYCAAKGGLGLLTKVMALELAERGITVNSVAPGHIATPMTLDVANGPGIDFDRPERPGIPVGRIGSPEEIAAAIVYLASPAAAYTTGTSVLVDGGLSLMAAVPLQEAVEA